LLEQQQWQLTTVVDARKEKITAEIAWDILHSASLIITAKGRSRKKWYPQTDNKAEILKDVIGRSGNLRAPALKVNDIFIIGFNAEMYAEQLPE